MSKHAPGPWTVDGTLDVREFDEDCVEVVLVNAGGDHDIAYVSRQLAWSDAVNAANARLIAAAPDLLAALEGVVRIADRDTNEFRAARAAIAKAKGEE